MSIPEADAGPAGGDRRALDTSLALKRCEDSQQWDHMLRSAQGSTAFHTWGWLELQARAHHWRFEPLLVLLDGTPLGVAPLLLTRRGVLVMEARVPFPYVGPVVPPEHLVGTLVALDGWARTNRVASSRMEFAPGATDARLAAPVAGWAVHQDHTLVVDLTHGSVDRFWSATRPSVRRTLRKAEERGVVVRPSTRTEVSTWLRRFLDEAYGSRGLRSPYAPDIGERIWDRYGDQEGVCMLSAHVGDEPGGLSLAFGHGDTLYSWAGGGFPSRRADHTGTALYVHEILWALDHGFQRVDEVGAVDEGVSRFKRSFGAHEEAYMVATHTHSSVWRRARTAYRRVKRAPQWLARGRLRRGRR